MSDNLGPGRPVILSLRKQLSHPRWRVVTADGEVMVSTAELHSYEKFCHACLDQLSKVYITIGQHYWVSYLATLEIIEETRPTT